MRVTVGVPEIDNAILKLRKLDALAGELFRKRITPAEYREQVIAVLSSMDETGIRMYSAPFVDENMLPPELDDGDGEKIVVN